MKHLALILTALSGLLCASLVAACTYVNFGGGEMELDSNPRASRLVWAVLGQRRLIVSYVHYGTRAQTPDAGVSLPGILLSSLSRDGNSYYTAILPYWLLISATAILPAISTLHVRRTLVTWHRTRHGLCSICGYDLRATRERCPECGTTVEAKV